MSISSAATAAVAADAPAFLPELSLLFVASALVAYVCHKLRIMPIVAFLLAGALLGPHSLGLVHNEALIEAAAEIGVILLLFTIGIEFSLEKLGRIKRLIVVGGGLQVVFVVGLAAGVLRLAGVDWRSGIFTGFLVALSSTAIVMKILIGRGEVNTEGGQASLGILIFQDLAVVAMVLLVPMLGGGTEGSLSALTIALAKAAGIIAVVLVMARRGMPKVLEAVARTCSQEIFLLTVIAICFGTAWLTSLAGVSLSLGAFLAGLIISESRFSELAFGEILPLQIIFSASFFVSVGLLLDVGYLFAHPILIAGVIIAVLTVKAAAAGLSLKLLGYANGTAAFAALLLAQIGEFSFVLERTGREFGLFPAGLQDGGPQAFIAATVVLMMGTPLLASLGDRLRLRSAPRPPARPAGPPTARVGADDADRPAHGDGAPITDHVIIAGYGVAARRLAGALASHGIDYRIVTLSPEGARDAEALGRPVLRGNYTRTHELTLAGARYARVLVVADDDLETTRRVVSAARALSPDLVLVARTRFESEIEELLEAGASRVIAEDQESIVQLLTGVLAESGVDEMKVRDVQQALRTGSPSSPETDGSARNVPLVTLSERQHQSTRCSHTRQAKDVIPGSRGCGECLQLGDTWVHLRICMTCGNVGCCDSSKNKHATRHHGSTGHPIMKSHQPGEDWAWCYEDRIQF